MTVRIGLEFAASGNSKTVSEILAIQAAIQKTAKESPGIERLASALGTNYQEAKKLAQQLNLTADQTQEAVQAFKQLQAVGADAQTTFLALAGRLGLTGEQIQGVEKAVQKYRGALGGTSQQNNILVDGVTGLAFGFNNVVSAVQSLVSAAKPAYDFLIGANEQLNAQLLSSQTNLASSTRIFQNGQEINDPAQKILATRPALEAALKQIEKDTQSLVGVTSSQVNELFQITLQNAAQLNNQSKQFPAPIEAATSLTKGWAAALKVIGVPLNQASQEINSILKGQLDQNSLLGKNLNITNEQVGKWKAQGTLVDELNKRLETFVAGNAIAARSIDGIGSNILDVFQILGREAGKPFLEPTISGLDALYKQIEANKDAILAFFKSISDQALQLLQSLGQSFQGVIQQLPGFLASGAQLSKAAIELIIDAIDRVGKVIGPVLGIWLGFQKAVIDAAFQVVNAIDVLGNIMENLAIIGSNAISPIVKKFQELLAALKPVQDAAGNLAQTFLAQLGRLNEAISNSPVGKVISSLLSELGKLAEDPQDKARQAAQAAEEAAKKAADASKGASNTLTIQGKEAQKLGDTFTQLGNKYSAAQRIIEAGLDGPELQKAFKDAVDLTKQQLELGQITQEEAEKRLNAINTNAKAEVDTQIKAKDTIVATRKNQLDDELAEIQVGQAKIQAQQAAGNLSEIAADRELTNLKVQEIQKRIEAAQRTQQTTTGDAKQKAINEEKKLQAELEKTQAEFAARERDRELKRFDNRRAISEANFAQGKTTQQQYNNELLAIDLAKSDAELKQLQDQLAKLSAADTAGREAINAKIAEVLKRRADIQKAAYDREVQLIEQQIEVVNDRIKAAETERQIDIQKLVNAGVLSEGQANQQRLASTEQRIREELAAEQDKYNKLKALPALTNPQQEAARQNQLRDQLQKTAQLQLQLLQNQEQREQAVRDAAIKAIQRQNAIQKAASDQAVTGLEKQIAATNRSAAAQEAINRSLDRQQKLLQSARSLDKALSDQRSSALNGELSGIDRAIALRKQLDSEQDPKKRQAIEQAINQLGFNAQQTESQFLQRKQQIEEQLAQQKRAALEAEQASQRTLLELDLQREESQARQQVLAAKRNVLDAESARIRAEQGVNDARAALAQAKQIKDAGERSVAIAQAQAQLAAAQQQLGNSKDQSAFAKSALSDAEKGLADQSTIAQNSRAALSSQQQAELAALGTEDNLRKVNSQLEISLARADEFAKAMERAASASGKIGSGTGIGIEARREGGAVTAGQPYLVGEDGPELVMPSRSGWVLTAQQTAALLGNAGMNGFSLPSVGGAASDPSLLQEVRSLNSSIGQIAEQAAYPKTLVVQNDQPEASAARIWADLSRERVRRSKL
jgi:hypothetical protein